MCNMISDISHKQDQNLHSNNLPILSLLNNQKKRSINYVKFRMKTVKIYKTYAQYQVEVNEYGKIWIMEIRYSALRQVYHKLKKIFGIKMAFPPKYLLGSLSPDNLKQRAIRIQQYLQQLSSNYKLINSDEFTQFLRNQEQNGTLIIDLTEQEEFYLDD